jgi:hypothetical protein
MATALPSARAKDSVGSYCIVFIHDRPVQVDLQLKLNRIFRLIHERF